MKLMLFWNITQVFKILNKIITHTSTCLKQIIASAVKKLVFLVIKCDMLIRVGLCCFENGFSFSNLTFIFINFYWTQI